MKTVVIKDEIYKVSEREYLIIKVMQNDIIEKSQLNSIDCCNSESKLSQHLEDSKHKYKFIGYADLVWL